LIHYREDGIFPTLPAWFQHYNERQTIEAGNKEMKGTFFVQHLMSRSPAGIRLQVLFTGLAANAVHGVSQGFTRELDIVGIGYRSEVKNRQVVFALGYSHPVVFEIPAGIEIAIEVLKRNRVETYKVKSIDRHRYFRSRPTL